MSKKPKRRDYQAPQTKRTDAAAGAAAPGTAAPTPTRRPSEGAWWPFLTAFFLVLVTAVVMLLLNLDSPPVPRSPG